VKDGDGDNHERERELQERLADGDLSVLHELNRLTNERIGLDPEDPEVMSAQEDDRRAGQRIGEYLRDGDHEAAARAEAEWRADVEERIERNFRLRPTSAAPPDPPRVHLRVIAPASRNRGAGGRPPGGRPAVKRVAAASTGGSSDDSSGSDGPGEPADLVIPYIEGERLGHIAVRLGVGLAVWAPRGELVVTGDDPELLARILPLALALIEDRRGLRAVGMPLVFDPDSWAVRIEAPR
jgi:hypothetical protein